MPDLNRNTNDFLNRVNSMVGSDNQYDTLMKSNPYLDYDYNQTIWDRLGNFIGFNTTEDKLRMQQQQSAREYAAQVVQSQREESYNSPLEQVQRMREAGINPELNGGVEVGSATEFDLQQSSPTYDGTGVEFKDFASTMLNVALQATGIASGFQDLSNKMVGQFDQDFGLASKIAEATLPFSEVNAPELFNIKNYLPSLNNRRAKSIDDMIWRLQQSPELLRKMYENKLGATTARKNYVIEGSSYNNPIQPFNNEESGLSSIVESLIKSYKNIQMHEYRSRGKSAEALSAQSDYQMQYYRGLDPAIASTSENAMNEATTESNDADRQLRSTYREIIDKLARQSENGDTWSKIALLLMMAGGNLTGSRSSGPKGINTSIGF